MMIRIDTDGAATSGTGTDVLTGETFVSYEHGIAIIGITQVSTGTVANDADWDLYINGLSTSYGWKAEELNPANVGLLDLSKSPIKIGPRRKIQLKWSGQGAAAACRLVLQAVPA